MVLPFQRQAKWLPLYSTCLVENQDREFVSCIHNNTKHLLFVFEPQRFVYEEIWTLVMIADCPFKPLLCFITNSASLDPKKSILE